MTTTWIPTGVSFETLQTCAAALVAVWGTEWHVVPPRENDAGERYPDHYATVERTADGAAITLSACEGRHGHESRIEVRGRWPKDGETSMSARNWGVIDWRESEPGITVAGDRPLHAIVQDIGRRFRPEYERLYAAVLVTAAKHANFRAAHRATVEAVSIALAGAGEFRDQQRDGEPMAYINADAIGYGQFTPTSLALASVPSDLLLAIARTIGQYAEARPK